MLFDVVLQGGGRLLSKGGRGRGHSKGVGGDFFLMGGVVVQGGVIEKGGGCSSGGVIQKGGVVLQGGSFKRGGLFFRGGGGFLTAMTEVSRYCSWALSSTFVALSQHGRKAGKV